MLVRLVLSALGVAVLLPAGGVSGESLGDRQKVKKGLCGNGDQESGYINVDEAKGKHLFYWLVTSDLAAQVTPKQQRDIPLMLWLTGGPGCSSMYALLRENGPCLVLHGEKTVPNPYSWTRAAHIIWIDQPVGVGYSYQDDKAAPAVGNEEEVSFDVDKFLQLFLADHPELVNNPFYLAGESYAGHFIPAIAHHILQHNALADDLHKRLHVNLKGISIGNGDTDQETVFGTAESYLRHNPYNTQLISESEMRQLGIRAPRCLKLLRTCNELSEVAQTFGRPRAHTAKDNRRRKRATKACILASIACQTTFYFPVSKGYHSTMDVRERCSMAAHNCYTFAHEQAFLRNPETHAALGIRKQSSSWQFCNLEVYRAFSAEWAVSFAPLIPQLLDAGIRVLAYAGDADFISNWNGVHELTTKLDWRGAADYRKQKLKTWFSTDAGGQHSLGQAKADTGGALTFVRISKAGHMTPYDQPGATYTMIDKWLNNESLVTPALPPTNFPTSKPSSAPAAAPTYSPSPQSTTSSQFKLKAKALLEKIEGVSVHTPKTTAAQKRRHSPAPPGVFPPTPAVAPAPAPANDKLVETIKRQQQRLHRLRVKEENEARDVKEMVRKIASARNMTADAVAKEKQLEQNDEQRGGIGKLVLQTLEKSGLSSLMNSTVRNEALTSARRRHKQGALARKALAELEETSAGQRAEDKRMYARLYGRLQREEKTTKATLEAAAAAMKVATAAGSKKMVGAIQKRSVALQTKLAGVQDLLRKRSAEEKVAVAAYEQKLMKMERADQTGVLEMLSKETNSETRSRDTESKELRAIQASQKHMRTQVRRMCLLYEYACRRR
jgi:cathepsin A (carboxypeptidase C)